MNLVAGQRLFSSLRIVSYNSYQFISSIIILLSNQGEIQSTGCASRRRSVQSSNSSLFNFSLFLSPLPGVFEKECSSIQPTEVLTEQEYRLFRHCVLTSRFPLLSVPSLPPDHTATDNPERPKSAVSKHSLADSISICSEIEEFDTSIIPTETLVDLVRRLFGLNPPRARQFEKLILAQYGRKNDAKVVKEI